MSPFSVRRCLPTRPPTILVPPALGIEFSIAPDEAVIKPLWRPLGGVLHDGGAWHAPSAFARALGGEWIRTTGSSAADLYLPFVRFTKLGPPSSDVGVWRRGAFRRPRSRATSANSLQVPSPSLADSSNVAAIHRTAPGRSPSMLAAGSAGSPTSSG